VFVCLCKGGFFQAAMVAMGQKGYKEHAENIYRCAQKIRQGVAEIPGVTADLFF
jgi:glutamate/tyrosine decarboxylase-like PLP-dependent enzyme